MAQMNSLIVSWNFDTVTGSDGSGSFIVNDTQNNYSGLAVQFSSNSNDFLLKEDIKTNRKISVDVLDSTETIQALEEDDDRIDALHKPQSNVLLIENSMYQIISDEMLNIFSTIDSYTFKFAESFNKYRDSYTDLDLTRAEFFSKIIEKPDVEKYIEFYKWIDSSLGYLLDQLKPENANSIPGLKNTIESHVLERNKYKHQLPLTVDSNRIFTSGIEVITKNSLTRSTRSRKNPTGERVRNDVVYVENSGSVVETIANIKNRNFNNNYEVIHTSGKVTADRSNKENKTVFKTKFSSVDGLSDTDRDWSDEYSSWNGLNNRATPQKRILNLSESLSTGIQGEVAENNFADNNFIQRSVPYTDENYVHTSSVNYQNIPSEQVQFLHNTNILIDINGTTYENSQDIVEPCVEFNVPLRMNLKIKDGLEFVDVLSPYSSYIDTFSWRNINKYDRLLDKTYINQYRNWFIKNDTFFYKAYQFLENKLLTISSMENLNVIFPRTDLIGLARIRTKINYEEEQGSFNDGYTGSLIYSWYSLIKNIPWSNNSYNNESNNVRSFWRDGSVNRRRTRGIDLNDIGAHYLFGSFNTYLYPNRIANTIDGENNIYYNPNIYNSMWSMDSQVEFSYAESGSVVTLNCLTESYGELAPYSHFYQSRFYLAGLEGFDDIYLQPKPQFVHNLFLHRGATGSLDFHLQFIFNKSYQAGLDCKITPFYDSYEDFRENIKHKSQNKSIIPEFIVSKFDKFINNNSNLQELNIEEDCSNRD